MKSVKHPQLIADHHKERNLGIPRPKAAIGCTLCALLSLKRERDKVSLPETEILKAEYFVFLIPNKDEKRRQDCNLICVLLASIDFQGACLKGQDVQKRRSRTDSESLKAPLKLSWSVASSLLPNANF